MLPPIVGEFLTEVAEQGPVTGPDWASSCRILGLIGATDLGPLLERWHTSASKRHGVRDARALTRLPPGAVAGARAADRTSQQLYTPGVAVSWPNTRFLHAADEPLPLVRARADQSGPPHLPAIDGATCATYTLTDDEEGKTIKVLVTFTDDAEHEKAITSDATKAVGMA